MSRRTSAVLGVVLAVAVAAPSHAAMTTPRFSKPAEGLAAYVPQTTCSPTAKPGVVRFSRAVVAAYPGTGSYGIVRACSAGGRSEHKEGRAWDWRVSAEVPAQRAQAHDLMRWLFATDAGGVRAANARRVGLMYLIFDRRIWSAYAGGTGWRPYRGANPHTDHMHLSFSWAGARAQTSWYGTAPRPSTGTLPAPPRSAPPPAPRPLPKPVLPVLEPEVDDDHEGGWRPGRPRKGDDEASHGHGHARDQGRGHGRAAEARRQGAAEAAQRGARKGAEKAAKAREKAAEKAAKAREKAAKAREKAARAARKAAEERARAAQEAAERAAQEAAERAARDGQDRED